MGLRVHDVRGHNFPTTGKILHHKKQFYVRLECNGVSSISTLSERGRNPHWSETFEFADASASIKLSVYMKNSRGQDVEIGSVEEKLEHLVSENNIVPPGERTINRTYELSEHDGIKSSISMALTLKLSSTLAASSESTPVVTETMTSSLAGAHKAWENIKGPPEALQSASEVANHASDVGPTATHLADDLLPFLDRMDAFVQLVSKISEIHPYAKIAVDVIFAGYKILRAQQQRDASLSELIDAMDDTYDVIIKARPLFVEESQKNIAIRLVEQTTECGYFIQGCAQERNFFKRAAMNILGGVDGKIKEFKDSFRELKTAFQFRAVIQTEIVVARTLDVVKDLSIEINLNDMQYIGDASFQPEKGCIPGTRTEIIEEICRWIKRPIGPSLDGVDDTIPENEPEGATLFWLKGFAGLGKSALANAVADRFTKGKRLGSSFMFDQSNADKRRAEAVFSKISRDIAGHLPVWKQALGFIIQEHPDLRESPSVRRQFEELILRPAWSVTLTGPLLVVIDALDECGGAPASRQELLHILSSRLSELPPHFRLFLTSRPETEIVDAFANCNYVSQRDLAAVSEDSIRPDLAVYFQNRLETSRLQPKFEAQWPARSWIPPIIDQSEGVFQWAFTACEFVLSKGRDPISRLKVLLNAAQSNMGLDNLYLSILRNVFGSDPHDDRLPSFRSVVGRTLCVQKPLSVSDLIALRDLDEEAGITESILSPLGSVLTGVLTGAPVQVFHTSFRDFLFDSHRGGIFHINVAHNERILAKRCLEVLNTELEFNLCQLQTSYTVQDAHLIEQAKASLRARGLGHLLYASAYWSSHLSKTSYNEELAALLITFTERQFLYWLEMLGAIGEIYVAWGAMRTLIEWTTNHNDKLSEFAKDVQKFISNFSDVIARSPPHLYISALPLAPRSSLISQQYLSQFSGILDVQEGKQQTWSPVDRTFGDRGDFETKDITSITYSPDGTILIAVAWTGLVWLWNPSTGQSIASFDGFEESRARIVEISPDGRCFALGSEKGEIMLRNMKTQAVLWGPETVGEGNVSCLRFSPDVQFICAGTVLAYMGAWDVATGKKADTGSRQLKLHSEPGRRLTISHDTTLVACSPYWSSLVLFRHGDDTKKWSDRREIASFTDLIWSLAFSPSGKCLISGHNSGAVKIWDVYSGDLMTDCSTQHTNQITSFAFSPDSSFFVSSAADLTVQLWSGAGVPIGKALSTSGKLNKFIAVAQDAKSFATSAYDGSIYTWDRAVVEQSSLLDAKQDSQLLFPSIITISDDAKHLYGACYDHSIREFDMETGAGIGAPMRGHRSTIRHLAISPDESQLVSCSDDRTLQIWDTKTRMRVHDPLEGHTDTILAAAFSRDGTRLLSCSADETIRIWDTATWAPIGEPLKGHTDTVRTAVFFDNAARIISGSEDQTIRIWDAESGDQIGEPLKLHNASIQAIAISLKEDIIASADFSGIILLWDPSTVSSTRGVHHTLHHGIDVVEFLAFSVDGTRLLSAGDDQTICLWDVATGKLIGKPFEGHGGQIVRAFFLEDKSIVSASNDGSIRIWDIEAESPEPESEMDLQKSFPRIDRDGWVHSDDDPPKLLFWLPPHYRPGFQWGRCRKVIGCEPVDIDFSRFRHGENWVKCIKSANY
ncbi:WD40 repeat-like protein [Sistotremastrum niveocremeum HHB9708]|uniref:WD40 repeat-like protein n=2 Tax=Sistotremastraceae TaxID=3402574 RepID=A0A164PA11_9AGAM|nr:WD40 repeat-like protein [Sistotremastrum niveocremeum HHB9708]KZT34115.1 WD40 repeat-like protein [Sistotremastrum suecicum HHB10207 ss-3]